MKFRGCATFRHLMSFIVASVVATPGFHGLLVAQRGPAPGGLFAKNPHLPAGAFTASSTLAHTTLRHEWVDIPFGGQRLHTWIE